MGMSASQARLISLTARMNDIEYQGQQINQQRTTLSNQITSLYNSLLEMKVPTPPSTSDYTRIVYSGIQGASKFTLGNVTPGKEKNTYNVDLKYEKTGHSWDSTAEANFTNGRVYYKKVDPLSAGVRTKTVTKAGGSSDSANISGAVMVKIKASDLAQIANQVPAFDKNSRIYSGSGSPATHTSNSGTTQVERFARLDGDGDAFEVLNAQGDNYVYVCFGGSEITQALLDVMNNDLNAGLYKSTDSSYYREDDYLDIKQDASFIMTIVGQGGGGGETEEYALDESSLAKVYVMDKDGNVRAAQKTDFSVNPVTGAIGLTASVTECLSPSNVREAAESGGAAKEGYVAVGEAKGYHITANGIEQPLISAKELFSGKEKATVEGYVEGLKNRFPDKWKEAQDVDTFLALFSGYTYRSDSGTSIYCIVQNEDLTQYNGQGVPVYEYVSNGTYTDTINEGDCKMEFDTDGRIIKIGIPSERDEEGNAVKWSWIDLSASEEADDKAYKDAYAKYEYEKYKYDKAQQDINAKTSIIQAEDKNLELKLTRLDNERNAVQTEIDAVKKVIQDDIEGSFKTFSG